MPLLLLQEKLCQFILASQDEETGGFSDRPGDMVNSLSIIWFLCFFLFAFLYMEQLESTLFFYLTFPAAHVLCLWTPRIHRSCRSNGNRLEENSAA